MSDFFHMGGYALYVWSAYGLAFIAMLALSVSALSQNKSATKRLTKRLKNKHASST